MIAKERKLYIRLLRWSNSTVTPNSDKAQNNEVDMAILQRWPLVGIERFSGRSPPRQQLTLHSGCPSHGDVGRLPNFDIRLSNLNCGIGEVTYRLY